MVNLTSAWAEAQARLQATDFLTPGGVRLRLILVLRLGLGVLGRSPLEFEEE